LWLVFRKNIAGSWCLLCGKAGSGDHLDGPKHRKKLDEVDWHLDSWNYEFIDWLRTDPTTAGPTSITTSSSRASAASSVTPADLDLKEDGSFTWQALGILKIMPKEPYWIVFRKELGDKWCLLCGKAADSWNAHTGSVVHVKRVASADYWMEYLGFGFLRPGGSGVTADPKGSASSAGASSSSCPAPSSSLASPPKTTVPWAGKSSYPKEEELANELGDEDLIHRLATVSARIQIDRADMNMSAVWLIPGRPGYIAIKEDLKGQKEDWKDPFCLLRGCHASFDHMTAPKHLDKLTTAAYHATAKGYEEVLQWLLNDVPEVIRLSGPNLPARCRKGPPRLVPALVSRLSSHLRCRRRQLTGLCPLSLLSSGLSSSLR
jgi:hypothetical protein